MSKNKKSFEYFSFLISSNTEYLPHKDTINENQFHFKCPQCHHIITLEIPPLEDTNMHCPKCSCVGIIRASEKTKNEYLLYASNQFLRYGKLYDFEKKLFQPLFPVRLIGILFILLSLILLYFLSPLNLKLSIMLIIIGAVILIILPGNKYLSIRKNNTPIKTFINDTQNHKTNLWDTPNGKASLKQFDISEKITLTLIILACLCYLVTGFNNIEIFVILIIIGILIIKELADERIPNYLKKRMNLLILPLLVIFTIIVIQWWLSF